ncbi:MAG: biopolymer transporter ExbD [Phycisphaerales bacterium]
MILRRESATAPGVGIDLTPVIDMVFLLLIFFLAATTFQRNERDMKIALPETHSAAPLSSLLKELVINIDSEGRAIVGGAILDDAALAARIGDAVKAHADQKVIVRGDRRATYASIARVLDICKRGGIPEPYLETQPIAGTGH